MNKIILCRSADLPDGEALRVDIAGRPPVAVYNVGGEFFATDDTCTHGTASLAEGYVEGHEIICPFHSGAFDIRTGQPTASPCAKALATHAVSVDQGVVYLLDRSAACPGASVPCTPIATTII